jgi:hypothetical protein
MADKPKKKPELGETANSIIADFAAMILMIAIAYLLFVVML